MATAITGKALNSVSRRPARRRVRWGTFLMWLAISILIFVTLFPFWWVLRTALTDPGSVFNDFTAMFPNHPTPFNFERVLGVIDPATVVGQTSAGISVGKLDFWAYFRNSVIVTLAITLGQTFFCALSGYAFARLKFPGRERLFFIYLTGLMIPSIVLFIPNYVLVRQMGWINTFQGIIVPTFFMTPFAVFFMRQFFLGLNKDLEESARLDGCTTFGVFRRIALPLISGPLLTLGILTFIGSWNDYLWPLLVGKDESVRVLTVALGVFRQQTPQGTPDWTGLMAAALVSMTPTLVLFMVFGRKVVDSIQFSGFK